MSFLEGILGWLLERILSYLLSKATAAAADAAARLAEDKRRGKVNDANVQAYEQAKDRAERSRAALRLLNRNPS